jgi:hypothetical protein
MKQSTKTWMAVLGCAVLAVMGTVTAVVSRSPAVTGGYSVVADTTATVPTTPSMGSVAPTSKAAKFQGGDWTGQ